jgi:hypothetical protein
MRWEDALELVVTRRNHPRLRQLCDASRHDHESWRAWVLEEASNPAPTPIAASTAPPAIPLAGDLVAAATARFGANRFARYVAAKLGVDCGCEARRQALNKLDRSLRRWLGW